VLSPGESLEHTPYWRRLCLADYAPTTSFTKLVVHNTLYCSQRTEPRQQLTLLEKFVKFGVWFIRYASYSVSQRRTLNFQNCSHVCARIIVHICLLLHTTQHRTVLIIFPLILRPTFVAYLYHCVWSAITAHIT